MATVTWLEPVTYDRSVPATLDDTFHPVLLSSMDEPLVHGELDAYFEKLVRLADAGIRARQQYVIIVTSDATKFTASGRKRVAEAQARFMTAERDAVTLAAFVPIDNALLRGAVTALSWLSPEIVKSIRVVASVEVALTEALRLLDARGTPFTGDLTGLRRALLRAGA